MQRYHFLNHHGQFTLKTLWAHPNSACTDSVNLSVDLSKRHRDGQCGKWQRAQCLFFSLVFKFKALFHSSVFYHGDGVWEGGQQTVGEQLVANDTEKLTQTCRSAESAGWCDSKAPVCHLCKFMTIRENDVATRKRGGIHMLNVRARIQRGPVEQEDWANKNPSGIQQGEAQSFGAERR